MTARESRRLFLTGAGVTLALPFLPSALWSRRAGAAACTPPRRFAAWFAPNGFNMPDWTPTTTGTTWEATAIAKPLEPIRKKILILTGLDHQDIAVPANPPGDHAAGTGCFLNMISVNGHMTDPARTSLDQVLLPALNPPGCPAPLLPSMQLGIQGENGLCDRAPCEFSRTISWNAGVPLGYIADPQVCFDKMFAGGDATAAAAEAARRAAARKSVLDAVLVQTKSLSLQLGAADRGKLDEHTTQVRNLETRLQRLGKSRALNVSVGSCTPPTRPAAGPLLNQDRGITPTTIVQAHIPLFADMMATAFQCDITRAITFMLGNGTSNNDYQFLVGTSAPHHGTTNTAGSAAGLAKTTRICAWEILQASLFLQKLDGMIESDGRSVLDHTTFYLSSDVANNDTHNHWDMPVLVAGGASGALKIDGRHINYIPQMPFPRPSVGPHSDIQTGRVFISMLRAHGIMQDTFGMATGGPLPELMP
ncbi:MAG: DUF1552 domain-containing protein [Pseudomonadota bacterium]